MTQRVWLTGGSRGIGAALVRELARGGSQVAVSSRNEVALHALRDELPMEIAERIHIFPVDVTDRVAVSETVERVESVVGNIDLCIFNAGDYKPMPAADFDPDLFAKLMDVNYIGVVNCLGAVLAVMLGRGKGQILINASLAGYRGLPLSAPYGATKAALISMAESLRVELHRKGVNLRIINHGFVKTELTDKNTFSMPFLITPEKAAKSIIEGVDRRGFEITFPRRFAYIMKLLRCLPYRLYFPLMERVVGR